MVKTNIIANNAFVKTDIDFEKIQYLAKFDPSKLSQYDDDGNVVFFVGISSGHLKNPLTKEYAYFNPEADADGKAVITVAIPYDGITDKKQWVAESYADALIALGDFENKLITNAAEVKAKFERVKDGIAIISAPAAEG